MEEDEGSSEASGNDPEDSVFTATVDDQEDPPSMMKSKRPKLVVSSDDE